jgi:hypothetical protein
MAKSDSFFIRAEVNLGHAAAYTQAEIDLGSFVNLGVSKSTIMRIHSVHAEVVGVDGLAPQLDANTAGSISWQLTTQSQGSLVRLSDKSVVASALYSCRNPDGSSNGPTQVWEFDVAPQDFTKGYLIGVDTLYLAGVADSDFEVDVYACIMLECTLETATQASSTALALSQQ